MTRGWLILMTDAISRGGNMAAAAAENAKRKAWLNHIEEEQEEEVEALKAFER